MRRRSGAPVPGAASAPTWPGPTPTVLSTPWADLWNHVASRTPALLAGRPPGEAAWPCGGDDGWTPAALAAAAGHVPVTVEHRPSPAGSFGRGVRSTVGFGDALERMQSAAPAARLLYLSAQAPPRPGRGNLPLPAGDLALALATAGLLPIRPAVSAGLVPAAVNLWLGGAAGGSGLHADVHDNLLTVVAGTKHVTLFPPAAVGDLACVGTPVRVWPNGRLVFAGPDEGAGPDGASEAAVAEAGARATQRAAAAAVAGRGGGTDDEEEAALAAALEAGEGGAGLDDYVSDEDEAEAEEGRARRGGGEAGPTRAGPPPPTFSRADLADPAGVRAAFPNFPWHLAGTVTVAPGHTLFIPAGWFHYVESAPEPRRPPRKLSQPPRGGGSGGGGAWAGLHAAVNYWFHPPDAAAAGGPENPYSRPFWPGVWEEAVAESDELRAALQAVEGGRTASPPPPPPPPPRPPTPDARAAHAAAAAQLLRSRLNDLARLEAGGAAALRSERRVHLLAALSGRRTRHGAAGVLPWAKRRRWG